MKSICKIILVFFLCLLYGLTINTQVKAINLIEKIKEDKESIVGAIANQELRADGEIVLNASNNLGEEKVNLSWTDTVEYPMNVAAHLSLDNKGLADGWGSYYVGSFTIYEACESKVDFYYTYWGNEPRNGNTTVEIWLIHTSTTGVKTEKRIIRQVQSSNKQDFTFRASLTEYLEEGDYVVQIRGNKPKWHGMLNVRGYVNFSTSNSRGIEYTIQQSRNNGEFTNVFSKLDERSATLTAANGVRDLEAPVKPGGKIEAIRGDRSNVNLKVTSTDLGTSYQYKVIGSKNGMSVVSNTTDAVYVLTGLKGFSYTIDKKSNTDPGNSIKYTINNDPDKLCEANITINKQYINSGYYLHIKAIDKVGNVSEILHIPLNYEEREINLYKTYEEAKDIDERGLAKTAGWDYIDLDWDKLEVKKEYKSPEVVLTIDITDSMNSNNRMKKAKNAASQLVNNLFNKFNDMKLGIVVFNGLVENTVTLLEPTNDLNKIQSVIKNEVYVKHDSGGTIIGHGISRATDILNKSSTKNKVLVLITDGEPNGESRYSPGYESKPMLARARSLGINVISLIIDANTSLVRDIFVNGSNSCYIISSYGDEIYSTLTENIFNDVLEIVTPKYNLYRKKEGDNSYTQITDQIVENNYSDKDAKDLAGPLKPIGSMTLSQDKQSLNLNISVEDIGTSYEYYLEAIMGTTGEIIYSNDVIQEVKTGVKGFAWTIDSRSNTDPGSNIRDLPESFDKKYIGQYIHIRGIDYAGNLGQVLHLRIDDGRLIPEEELDQTKELFCVQHGQTIPALVDGRYLNATITAGTGEYKFTQTVKYPNTGDVIGRKFVEGTTTNIYGTEDIITYSIGKYRTSLETPTRKPGKEGNANEKEAYILSYYGENDGVDSDEQKAMYTTDVSSGNITWDWDDTPNSKALVAEANAYEAYRKAGYNPDNYKKSTNVYMSEDYSEILLGPLKLKYNPQGISVEGSKRGDVYFARIIGARLYDQNGNVFAEKGVNGETIGDVQWDFVYTTTGTKRSEKLFSYDRYKFPVGDEEFYIKIKYTSEMENITKISKIEFSHEELIADAQYEILEGTYNKVTWTPNRIKSSDRDVLWCNEVEQGKSECIHGKTYSHIIGCYFYLTATVYDSYRDIPSQKLIEVDWGKRYYKYSEQVVDPSTGVKDPDDGDDGGDDGDNPGGTDPGETDPGGTDPGGDGGDDGR